MIMALPTFTLPADTQAGAPAGAYVPAELATAVEQALAKLTWTVLYGKFNDASSLAVGAEQLLARLSKTGQLA
jgi:hypothetical protein